MLECYFGICEMWRCGPDFCSDQIGDNKNQNHDDGYDNNYRFPSGDLFICPFRVTIGITPWPHIFSVVKPHSITFNPDILRFLIDKCYMPARPWWVETRPHFPSIDINKPTENRVTSSPVANGWYIFNQSTISAKTIVRLPLKIVYPAGQSCQS